MPSDIETLQVIAPDGTPVGDPDVGLGDDDLRELLADRFESVVILTTRNHIAEDTSLAARQRILRRFHARNIQPLCLVEPLWSDAMESEARLEYVSVYGGPPKSIAVIERFTAVPKSPFARNVASIDPVPR